jgi:hypothetical protein
MQGVPIWGTRPRGGALFSKDYPGGGVFRKSVKMVFKRGIFCDKAYQRLSKGYLSGVEALTRF